MINIYCENEVFGKYTVFDTDTGKTNIISEKDFNMICNTPGDRRVFRHDNVTHTIFPRIIYFQIIRKCNLNCPYCFISAEEQGEEVPWSDIKDLADYFEKQGLMEVRLTGGEPTIHTRFEEIVDEFRNRNIYVSVATNGCWSKSVLEFFKSKKNIFLIISLDGNKTIQDTYRSKSFDTIIQNIEELRRYNKEIRIRLNTVLTQKNYLSIEYLFSLAQKYDIEYINFIPLKPQVRSENMKKIMLSGSQYKQAVELMVKFRRKYGVKFNTSILFDANAEIMGDKLYRQRKHCSAGVEGTNLDYDFTKKTYRLFGCAYSPAVDLEWESVIKDYFVAGEFKIEELEHFAKIWENDLCWKIFRNNLSPTKCIKCDLYGKGCVGACVIQNIDYENLEKSADREKELNVQLEKMSEYYCEAEK